MLINAGASLRRPTLVAARRILSRAPGAAAAAAAAPNPPPFHNDGGWRHPSRVHQLQLPHQLELPHHHEQRRFVHVEQRLQELGITLPPAAGPRANYDVVCHDESARVLYVSGHLPFLQDGTLMTGRITGDGDEANVEYGYKAARQAALNILGTLSDRLDGDLDRIEQIQKVFGIVQSGDGFRHQHLVMDGASDLFMEVFGDRVGYHARSAIGV